MRAFVALVLVLAVALGGWWVFSTARRASLEPLPVERVAQETPPEAELFAPDAGPVQRSAAEAATAPPERVEVALESRAASATLLVRVFDAMGEPWLEPTRIPADRRDPQSARITEWPARLRVLVFEHDDLGGLGSTVGAAVAAGPARGSGFEYEVLSGTRYLVGAIGPGFDGSLRDVGVPFGEGHVVVDLYARDLGEPALLSVRVFHRGRELDGGLDEDPFALQLRGRDGNLLLSSNDGGKAPFQLRAPGGDYRLVVEGRAGTDPQHGSIERVRFLGRCEKDLRLSAGGTEEVRLEIGEGARLEVTLTGQIDDADLQAARVSPWAAPGIIDPREQEAAIRRASARAELHLISDGRRREPVFLLTPAAQGTSAEGVHLRNWWPLGATRVSECLPAGRHTLVARLPGGREARAEVELFEGRTTPVQLRF